MLSYKYSVVLVALFVISLHCEAQGKDATPLRSSQRIKKEASLTEYPGNAIYLEAGGSGIIYSLGYEATFYHTHHFSAVANVGAGYFPLLGGISSVYIQPGALFHFGKSAVELGLAAGYLYSGEDEGNYDGGHIMVLVPRLGYRYTFYQNKCFVRLGITPFLYNDLTYRDKGFQFWGNAATFGFRF